VHGKHVTPTDSKQDHENGRWHDVPQREQALVRRELGNASNLAQLPRDVVARELLETPRIVLDARPRHRFYEQPPPREAHELPILEARLTSASLERQHEARGTLAAP